MRASATKDKQSMPLRTVKVRASASARQSAKSDNTGRPSTGTEDAQDNTPIEDMVNKGLDLAEAGIGLGVNIVVRLGSILKDQVFDKFNSADMLSSVMSNTTPDQQQPGAQSHAGRRSATNVEQEQISEQSYYLFNRLPLYPGSRFSLSFSVNNDSLTSEKKIKLVVEPFVGELHNAQIPTNQLTVTPPETSIAAVDFEKFVLSGTIGEDLPADTYHSWIIVTAEQSYRIPVVLNVSAGHQRMPAKQQTDSTESHSE